MKSRNGNLILVVLAALTVQAASAQTTQTQDTGWRATFSQVTVTVKQTVKRMWDYWNGIPVTPAPQDGAAPQTAAAPAATPPTPTATTATTAAPATTQPVKAVAPPTARVTPNETVEQAELRSQPIFQEKLDNSSIDDVKSVAETVKKTPVLKVATPGVQGTSRLPRSKAGIPVSDFKGYRVSRSIPRLDIGTEPLISAKDFAYGNLNWNEQSGAELKRLPLVPSIYSHELSVALRIKGQPAPGPRDVRANTRLVGQIITQASVDSISYKLHVGEDAKPLPYRKFTEEELKMAAALILFSRGTHCHMVMGLFHQIAQAPKTKVEATYHLGACADQLQMHQAAFDNLAYVVASGDKDYAAPALALLADDLPQIYETDFYKLAKKIPNFKSLITEKNRDAITYRMAKGAYRMKDYATSMVYADQVGEKSDLYTDARVLSAMNSFAQTDKKRALKKLEGVWQMLEARKEPNSNIRALTAINLARMNFSLKKFDKALDYYMQVPKDHAFWVQGLIEQGWTQLSLADYAGAIGNMYSLHSPYFKAVYQPESFVVRTIGYLNICQYGDAYKSLSWLEKDYRDWYKRLDQYLVNRSEPASIYKTVTNYIRGKSTDSVEGVPYQLWREMARQKDFLNLQTALNDKADESRRYEGVNAKIKKEKAGIRTRSEQAKRRFDEWRRKIASLKSDKSLVRELPQWQASLKLERDLIMGLRYQLALLEQGRQSYLKFQSTSQEKLDVEAAGLTRQAGTELLARAKEMHDEMVRVLENNEFLRYEIFSGSGENIRYQVAGGEVAGPNRIPAHIKPTKMMNWAFDGEFWEDEIGSYRSSLQNNCPTSATDQARLGQ